MKSERFLIVHKSETKTNTHILGLFFIWKTDEIWTRTEAYKAIVFAEHLSDVLEVSESEVHTTGNWQFYRELQLQR